MRVVVTIGYKISCFLYVGSWKVNLASHNQAEHCCFGSTDPNRVLTLKLEFNMNILIRSTKYFESTNHIFVFLCSNPPISESKLLNFNEKKSFCRNSFHYWIKFVLAEFHSSSIYIIKCFSTFKYEKGKSEYTCCILHILHAFYILWENLGLGNQN